MTFVISWSFPEEVIVRVRCAFFHLIWYGVHGADVRAKGLVVLLQTNTTVRSRMA